MQTINGCEKVCVCAISPVTPLLPKEAMIFHLLVPLSDSFVLVIFLHYDLQVNDQTVM